MAKSDFFRTALLIAAGGTILFMINIYLFLVACIVVLLLANYHKRKDFNLPLFYQKGN